LGKNNKDNFFAVNKFTIQVQALLTDSINVKQELLTHHVPTIVKIAQIISQSIQQGGKVLLCGNGGSAADAQHLAAELLIRLRSHVNRQSLPALALATDTSSLTACGNDYSFDVYYERLTRALGKKGDVLIGLTTSGKSSNIIRALQTAREMGIVTVGLLGGDGGSALTECDVALIVPSFTTERIQEAHITIGHAVIELVEDMLMAEGVIICS
jgi:D-sedoheptulose 7-phosphate isomerase